MGVTDPLRVFETAYSLNDTPSGYVDDIQGAIAKFGDEQPPTPEVHGHVVDTPTCVRQEDGRLQNERRREFRSPSLAWRHPEKSGEQATENSRLGRGHHPAPASATSNSNWLFGCVSLTV